MWGFSYLFISEAVLSASYPMPYHVLPEHCFMGCCSILWF